VYAAGGTRGLPIVEFPVSKILPIATDGKGSYLAQKCLVHLRALVTLVFVLDFAATVRAQCNSNEVLVGEDADNYYCMEKAKYDASPAKNLASQFCHAKYAVAGDQNAIRALGFNFDAQRFELFTDVAKDQKADLEHKVFDALLDQSLEGSGMAFKSAKSLNPWNVNNAVNMLKDKGFGNTAIINALRRVAAQKDKPAMYAAYKDFVELAKSAKEGWATGSDMAKDPDNANLRFLLGALKVMQGNPELGAAVTTLEFGENLAYLYYLTGEVNDLAKASGQKMKRLSELSAKLNGDVKALTQSKRGWQASTGYRTGTPVCK
jgi:hypothetical protein